MLTQEQKQELLDAMFMAGVVYDDPNAADNYCYTEKWLPEYTTFVTGHAEKVQAIVNEAREKVDAILTDPITGEVKGR